MRIVTWNINGIQTILQYHPWNETKSFKNLLDSLEADIICLQEIKCRRTKITREFALVPGYDAYFSFSRSKHGYSGVAVYVRLPLNPISAEEGITGHDLNHATFEPSASIETHAMQLDAEGRCVILEFDLFVLMCIYFPNDASEERRSFKMDYHRCVEERTRHFLNQGKNVIIAGDVNAMHKEIDCCDPKKNMKEWGITQFQDLPGRQWLDQFLAPKGPMIDLSRRYHPARLGMFTCTRIDYVLASQGLERWFKYSDIQPDYRGSDHCPVYADFHDTIEITNADGTTKKIDIRDLLTSDMLDDKSQVAAKNFDEFSNKQKKLSSFFSSKRSIDTNGSEQNQSASIPQNNTPVPLESPLTGNSSDTSSSSQPVKPKSTSNVSSSSISPSRKKLKPTITKPTTPPNQKAISAFFTPSSAKKQSASQLSNDASEPANSVQQTDVNEDEEFVDIELLMKQHQQSVQAGNQWNALFTPRRSVPICNVHKEPCKEFVVNKKGPNHGRRFYLCSRPVGPQGEADSMEYRCNYFIWQTEFDKKRSGTK